MSKALKIAIGVGSVALVVVIGLIWFFSTVNGARNAVISKEQALTAQYQDNQNELSAYILKFKETMGIADKGSERMDEIIQNAVTGRYGEDLGSGSPMFLAISEAYPDLTATNAMYEKVQDEVVAGRNAFKNKQSKLLDMTRDYKTYINQGLVRSVIVRDFVKAPTDMMEVRVGDKTYTGKEALDKMGTLVLTQDAVDSFDTGTAEPLIE